MLRRNIPQVSRAQGPQLRLPTQLIFPPAMKLVPRTACARAHRGRVHPFPSSDASSGAIGAPTNSALPDCEVRAMAQIRPSEPEAASPQDPTGQVRWYARIVVLAMRVS